MKFILILFGNNSWIMCFFKEWIRVGKTSKYNCVGVTGGIEEENIFLWKKCDLRWKSIFLVKFGIWVHLFYLLINWTRFRPQHLFAIPSLKITHIIPSISVIILFLFLRCMASILQSLWRLCSLPPILNILCYILCTFNTSGGNSLTSTCWYNIKKAH